MSVEDLYWGLAGPARFLDQVSTRLMASRQGLLGISVPSRRPPGFLDAVLEQLREQGGGRVIRVRADDPIFQRSIAHGLARAAGLGHSGLSSVAELAARPELAAATFVVDGVRRDVWNRWASFLRTFAAESSAVERTLAPNIAVLLPAEMTRGEIHSLFGRDEVPWRGVVTTTDTRVLVSRLKSLNGSETLAERIAMETTIRLAGWDLNFAGILAERSIEEMLNPIQLLADLSGEAYELSWGAGIIDEWDGLPFTHTLACAAHGDLQTLRRRIWTAHSSVVLPFIGEVIEHYCAEYRELLEGKLPYTYMRGETRVQIHDLADFEIGNLYHALSEHLSPPEVSMLKGFVAIRNRIAHHRLPELDLLVALSDAWETFKHASPRRGNWAWPRCGQRLTLWFGHPLHSLPRDGHISLVELRSELQQAGKDADDASVHLELKKRIAGRLGHGASANLDATHLTELARIDLVDLVPRDMRVVYAIRGGDDTSHLSMEARSGDGRLHVLVEDDDRPSISVIGHVDAGL